MTLFRSVCTGKNTFVRHDESNEMHSHASMMSNSEWICTYIIGVETGNIKIVLTDEMNI